MVCLQPLFPCLLTGEGDLRQFGSGLDGHSSGCQSYPPPGTLLVGESGLIWSQLLHQIQLLAHSGTGETWEFRDWSFGTKLPWIKKKGFNERSGKLCCTLIEPTSSVHLTSAHDLCLFTHACIQMAIGRLRSCAANGTLVPDFKHQLLSQHACRSRKGLDGHRCILRIEKAVEL